MSRKAWNSLKWEPDFTRPDKVTLQLNDIRNVVTGENGTKYLKIDEKAFNSADHNYVYATEFNRLRNYRSGTCSGSSGHGRCDSSSQSRSGKAGVCIWRFCVSGGGSSSSSKSSCKSLFNSVSSRSVSDLDMYNSKTDVTKTSVERSGLSNFKVTIV